MLSCEPAAEPLISRINVADIGSNTIRYLPFEDASGFRRNIARQAGCCALVFVVGLRASDSVSALRGEICQIFQGWSYAREQQVVARPRAGDTKQPALGS
jgi:hypothetical protein